MIYKDYIRAGAGLCRDLSGRASLVCVLLLCPAGALGRQAAATAPAAPAAATPPARPAQTKARTHVRVEAAPRAPHTAQAPATPAAAPIAPARATPPHKAGSLAPLPPREVVTVVHRLSGWKLLAWLAASGPPAFELDALPSLSDAHTNIVAGYIYDDGRSVVARFPQAEVELESFAAPSTPPGFFASTVNAAKPEPEYMLVTAEGRRVEAKFVGLDSSTGLALLEAKEMLLSSAPTGTEGNTEDPSVGQRVLLYAPTSAGAPTPVARASTSQQDPDYVYLVIDQKEGLVTQVRPAPSGRPSRVVVRASTSPEWVGAIAANELGEVVGIVSQSRNGETQIVPMAAVHDACDRVLKLRGNAPQPWLGARGDAAAQAPLDAWVNFGWKPEMAMPYIEKRQGVFITSVAPGTPAALAGLQAGDLIASVGQRDVRSAEDLSLTLREAGVGSIVDLTVWRAMQQGPLKVSVELKGAKNPALATAEAEERALRASLLGSEREIREAREAEVGLRVEEAAAREAELAHINQRLVAAEQRAARLRTQLEQARAKVSAATTFNVEGAPVIGPLPPVGSYATGARLKLFGLNVVGLSPRSAAPLGASGGLLVVAVQPESPAAASGLLVGDVIETLNGAPVRRFELRRPPSTPEASTLVFGLVRDGRRLTVRLSPSFGNEQQR